MGIALIILIIIFLCWPSIMKWVKRFMANRAEDYLRKATGMPPRPGSRADRKRQREEERRDNYSNNAYGKYGRQSYRRKRRGHSDYDFNPEEPLIPKEYAEDVEFVETRSYSETTIGHTDAKGYASYHESQVSDAEWEEIKIKK